MYYLGMCCTFEPAKLSDTVIYSAEVKRDGELLHVLGYQNKVHSYGPNAMLLPFPAAGKIGRDNLVNGEKFPRILDAYSSAIKRLKPRTRSATLRRSVGAFRDDRLLGSYEVFESGSYTIILTETALAIPEALKEVSPERRVTVKEPVLAALNELYPTWPFALCCFNGSMGAPEPLFWWFKPRHADYLFAPAIDAHDGNPPNLEAMVERSHTIAFASHASERDIDKDLQHDIFCQVAPEHQWMFLARVAGRELHGPTQNGDFVHPVGEIRDRKVDGWLNVRVAPPPKDRVDVWDRLLKDDLIAAD